MPAKAYEGGIRPYRLEFVRETTFAAVETDPAYNLYSDAIQSFDPGIDPGTEGQRSVGDPDFVDHFTSTMSATPTVQYHLQQKTSSGDTLLDSSGNSNDALTDGLQRTSDNRLAESHQIVRRMEQDDLDAGNTVNGSTSLDTRQYIVYYGALVNDVSAEVDPSSPQPIMVTLDYVCRKAEVHQIDQPASSTTLDVVSSNTSDSGSVTIEDEDAGTTETITISANGTASGTTSFANIDSVELSAEQPGDITINDGSNDLMVIRGQDSHDHGEGDLGVPNLGNGSHASAIGQSYETPQATTLEKPGGTDLSDEVMTTEVSIGNGVSEDGTTTGPRPVIIANERTPQADVTVAGEVEYFTHIQDALQTTTENFQLDLGGGETIQLDSAAVLETGGEENAGQGLKEVDATIEGQGVSISS